MDEIAKNDPLRFPSAAMAIETWNFLARLSRFRRSWLDKWAFWPYLATHTVLDPNAETRESVRSVSGISAWGIFSMIEFIWSRRT